MMKYAVAAVLLLLTLASLALGTSGSGGDTAENIKDSQELQNNITLTSNKGGGPYL